MDHPPGAADRRLGSISRSGSGQPRNQQHGARPQIGGHRDRGLGTDASRKPSSHARHPGPLGRDGVTLSRGPATGVRKRPTTQVTAVSPRSTHKAADTARTGRCRFRHASARSNRCRPGDRPGEASSLTFHPRPGHAVQAGRARIMGRPSRLRPPRSPPDLAGLAEAPASLHAHGANPKPSGDPARRVA